MARYRADILCQSIQSGNGLVTLCGRTPLFQKKHSIGIRMNWEGIDLVDQKQRDKESTGQNQKLTLEKNYY